LEQAGCRCRRIQERPISGAATRHIRKLPGAAAVSIAAMAASALAEDKARRFGGGMNAFISKPAVPETLFAVLLKRLAKAGARPRA